MYIHMYVTCTFVNVITFSVHVRMSVCAIVQVCVCVCARVRACMGVSVNVSVCVCEYVCGQTRLSRLASCHICYTCKINKYLCAHATLYTCIHIHHDVHMVTVTIGYTMNRSIDLWPYLVTLLPVGLISHVHNESKHLEICGRLGCCEIHYYVMLCNNH